MKWNDDHTITIIPPAKPKKITGTRFAAVLGLNQWTTPFNAWCAITRTYEEPFEDTIYTIAGKTIEPKQAAYMAGKYFWKYLLTPTDVYGEEYFNQTRGDFFPDKKVYGGMWDYLFVDEKGNPETVLEMKTTKRAEDWLNDIPEYYAMQAALYAYLLHVDNVIMVCTVLEDKDYQHPESFVVSKENTFERSFKVSERYPRFEKIIEAVNGWWADCVEKGVSPVYDEKKDAEILKVLRENNVNPDTDLQELIKEAEDIQGKLDVFSKQTEDLEKRQKVLKDMIKQLSVEQFRDGDKKVSIAGGKYVWETSKSVSKKIDEDAMKADGVLDKYKTKETVTYTLRMKNKGDK